MIDITYRNARDCRDRHCVLLVMIIWWMLYGVWGLVIESYNNVLTVLFYLDGKE